MNSIHFFKIFYLIFLVLLSACNAPMLKNNSKTPYTVIEPEEDFYYEELPEESTTQEVNPNTINRANPFKRYDKNTNTPYRIKKSNPITNNTPTDYQKELAQHIYKSNKNQIFQGKLPPLLYAIGVTETSIDSNGNAKNVTWLRKPVHAPEVVTNIESVIYKSNPFPKPKIPNSVLIVETWLWDSSGKFQLRTLSEGQLDKF